MGSNDPLFGAGKVELIAAHDWAAAAARRLNPSYCGPSPVVPLPAESIRRHIFPTCNQIGGYALRASRAWPAGDEGWPGRRADGDAKTDAEIVKRLQADVDTLKGDADKAGRDLDAAKAKGDERRSRKRSLRSTPQRRVETRRRPSSTPPRNRAGMFSALIAALDRNTSATLRLAHMQGLTMSAMDNLSAAVAAETTVEANFAAREGLAGTSATAVAGRTFQALY